MAVSVVVVVVVVAMVVVVVAEGAGTTSTSTRWCVARSNVSEQELQTALDYACGGGADCAPIQSTGLCYLPNTLQAHASYAFDSFFQRKAMSPGSCDFSGTATVAMSDPSYGSCVYPSSQSSCYTFFFLVLVKFLKIGFKHGRRSNHTGRNHSDNTHYNPKCTNGSNNDDTNLRCWLQVSLEVDLVLTLLTRTCPKTIQMKFDRVEYGDDQVISALHKTVKLLCYKARQLIKSIDIKENEEKEPDKPQPMIIVVIYTVICV
ncbi:hypothetical protein HHK36_013077 [Tetracentron sinense]|uniref:X8 domain-containing protein n=1 Tax=Tetracentron sinense TaxID=13715 RepID=A0A834Z7Y9_TETSI|nr:hypothetical protein HHK36_013077 [Tetracentron sinense]